MPDETVSFSSFASATFSLLHSAIAVHQAKQPHEKLPAPGELLELLAIVRKVARDLRTCENHAEAKALLHDDRHGALAVLWITGELGAAEQIGTLREAFEKTPTAEPRLALAAYLEEITDGATNGSSPTGMN